MINLTPDPTAYLNGEFLPLTAAKISPLDRGFSFGDGIYEVIPVFKGKPFGLKEHILRLNSGLAEIYIKSPLTLEEWQDILSKLIEKNSSNDPFNERSNDQWIYLQITRGCDPIRDHQFPKNTTPTVFAVSYPKIYPSKEAVAKGLKVTGITDIRWKYSSIKTISRLAYVLMYHEVQEGGFDEGIIINNGIAWEGTTSNFFIVRHGVIQTPICSTYLLNGITRNTILRLAEKNNIPYRETKITERELLKADEIWITSSTRGIFPVKEFNGQTVGNGKVGSLWDRMYDLYQAEINQC